MRTFLLSLPKLPDDLRHILQHFDVKSGTIPIPVPTNVSAQSVKVQNLIIPTDALWHGTSFYLFSPVALDLLGSGASIANLPIISAEQVTGALLLWVVVYSMVLPALAVWRFQKRDI